MHETHVYGTKDLTRLFGIRPTAVRALVQAGHIRPHRGARGKLRFSFQDLIVLRTAEELRAAKIPSRRINRCLRQLRSALPASMPLTGLSITAVGDQVAVREGRRHWESESGQYLLALDVNVAEGEVRVMGRPVAAAGVAAADDAVDGARHLAHALELEETDPAAALLAYEQYLAHSPADEEARLNYGRLLHLRGRLLDAERVYAQISRVDATVLFNLAVLLEDLGRESEAIARYREALDLVPTLADAHFNLARLHEKAGNQRDSLRHLMAYRRTME